MTRRASPVRPYRAFGDLFSRQHLPGHAGMSAAFQATTAFKLTGAARSADRSATDAHTVVAASLWPSPGASLSFAGRGSFTFPCSGYARLATTATLRLGSGFSSGEHAGVLKWACGAPAAGAPKALLSGVIAAPATVSEYRFLGQSHYSARATAASGQAGSELRWIGVLEGTLAAAAGAHASAAVVRLAFDEHLGTFSLAAAQKTVRPRENMQSVCLCMRACLCVIY